MESKFRKHLRDLLLKSGYPSYSHEHRSGGSSGFPDTTVIVCGMLLPVELKLGAWSEPVPPPAILHCSRLRPVQIGWFDAHTQVNAGRAALVIGVRGRVDWDAWALRSSLLRRDRLRHWRLGFPLGALRLVASGDELLIKPDWW